MFQQQFNEIIQSSCTHHSDSSNGWQQKKLLLFFLWSKDFPCSTYSPTFRHSLSLDFRRIQNKSHDTESVQYDPIALSGHVERSRCYVLLHNDSESRTYRKQSRWYHHERRLLGLLMKKPSITVLRTFQGTFIRVTRQLGGAILSMCRAGPPTGIPELRAGLGIGQPVE